MPFMPRHLARLFSAQRSIAWIVLLAGLLLTLLTWQGLRARNTHNTKLQFDIHAQEIVEAIEKRLSDHAQILLGCAGLFDASTTITRTEWRTYVERLHLDRNYPGILGTGFSQVIHPTQLQAHIDAIRAEGFSDYTVKPAGARPLYTAIIYLEPFKERNLAAFGYDMFSEETRRQAMQVAADSGETRISGKVRLVQETHGKEQAGFLMYVPIYRPGLPLSTPPERWLALQGFVYSAYRMDDLMQGILGKRDLLLDFSLHDGDTVSPDILMYDTADSRPDRAAVPLYTELRQIQAYGRTWTVSLRSRPSFETEFSDPLPWLVPLLGLGICLSLFALTWSLLGRQEQALALADEMAARRQESEQHFHQLFLHIGQGVVIHAADGRITDANPAAERILGLSLAQMQDTNAPMNLRWKTICEDGSECPDPEHPVRQALRTGAPVTDVVMGVFHPGDNDWHWIQVDAYPRYDQQSAAMQQVYAVFSDITEMRRIFMEIRQARKFLTDLLSAASEVSIIATDRDGLITIFNRGAEHLVGYKAAEMVGKQTPAILHLSEEIAARGVALGNQFGRPIEGFRVFVEMAERHGAEKREWTYVHKDGHTFPISMVVTTMRDDSGEISGYLGIAEDITERKQAANALREQMQRTQAILDNVIDGIITIDERGTVASLNFAAEGIFGYPPNEVQGQNVKMLMPEPYHSEHDGYLSNYRDTGAKRIIGIGREVVGRRKDGGTFPMELAVSEISHGGQRMFVGLVRDISERKRVEQMKSEFVSTVSHELRTPLTSIAGSLSLLLGGAMGEPPAPMKPLLDIAFKNSQRLALLINDLLDMEKIAAGRMDFDMQVTPLMPLLEQSLTANQAYGEARRVSFALTERIDDNLEVRIDSQRLQQVLANFLSNAVKFSPEDSQVKIAVQHRDGHVRIAVHDRGPGIPDEFRGRIFEKFSQADSSDTRQKGGTGLGLAISRELMEQMGGTIGYDSVAGQGATFWFELPIYAGDTLNTCILKSQEPPK